MPGSDQKINYQIRPSKSVERKMLCDLVKEIQIIEGKSELRYIGMGAKYFTDFLLLHNEFGVSDMISIEAEEERRIRYEFNKPLKCIEMKYGTTNEILPQIEGFDEKVNLVWLDYDDVFSDNMVSDVETICRNIEIGSMFFISCNYSYRGENPKQKRESFEKNVGIFFDETIDRNMFTSKKIPLVIRNIVTKKIKKTIEMRNRVKSGKKIEFMQLLFLTYKDGAPILTIGGIIVDEEMKYEIEKSRLFDKYIYMSRDEESFFIDIPKLTNKEIQVILKNIPLSLSEYNENFDNYFGISFEEIQKFEKIYRYYPYFTEGCFIT